MKLKPLKVRKVRHNRKNEWSPEQIKALIKLYPVVSDVRKLAKQLGKTYVAVKSKALVLKLKRERRSNDPWTEERILVLKEKYHDTLNSEIAEMIGLRETQIEAKAFKLGLKKTKDFMYYHSMKTCFKKGHTPINKGKKQQEYMTREAIERTRATRFKKGDFPGNTLYDGVITVRHSSKARGAKPYKTIRIALGKWQELQRFNWEKVNGLIPKGMCLWCKNGDTLNCEPDNWELVTRKENMLRNSGSLHMKPGVVATWILGKNNHDPEIFQAIKNNPKIIETKRLQLQLNRTINEHRRKNK